MLKEGEKMTDDQQDKVDNSHRYFSATCFNACWDLIDKNPKTEEDLENMIHLAHTSFWHWTQVQGVQYANLSVGYWQISRVYSIANQGERSLYFGKRCIETGIKNDLDEFYIGYGYEAVARAYQVLGKTNLADENKEKALDYCKKVADEENKKLLEADLRTLF